MTKQSGLALVTVVYTQNIKLCKFNKSLPLKRLLDAWRSTFVNNKPLGTLNNKHAFLTFQGCCESHKVITFPSIFDSIIVRKILLRSLVPFYL